MVELKGIDVSKHQGIIDWEKVKQFGIQFAMLRAGYGKNANQKDSQFERNYLNAKAVGMPVGAYHYSYAKSVDDARKEAKIFLKNISGKQFEYPVAFDIEDESMYGLGKNMLTQIALAFCLALESAGYYVAIYASKDWVINKLDMSVLKRFDLWLAKWGKNVGYSGKLGMWQYSSNGYVNGISGNVDLDLCYKDYPSIIKSGGLNGFPKLPYMPPIKHAQIQSGDNNVNNLFEKGNEVHMDNTPIYASADATKPVNFLVGTYYLYDGIEFSTKVGIRYRITKNPQLKGITGYIDKSMINYKRT